MALPQDAKQISMTPEQWKRAGEVFQAALDLARGEREPWVRATCADDPAVLVEVLSLLESDEAAAGLGFFAAEVGPAVASLARASTLAGQPIRVGPYKLTRELGQGGMGTVYLAERDDDQYTTQVAIKLVRRGFDTDLILNRFYRERQTLARLQHPNIARLLDGGTTPEGLPYIVMEYVQGSRITDYCREHGLSVAQRLALFLNVCKAVDHAHRQLVVHRDIKPGNIMVDQTGDVKLLDFGICKLLQAQPPLGEETIEGGPLTPDYASPEQIRGDLITVASDIYSLAAVLYELLTNVKPHRITNYSIQGIEKGISEGEITRPSLAAGSKALARQLRGDLDTILLYAMQKDPARRYASAEQFAEDIRRYLAYQPVVARPDTLVYRTAKLFRRRGGTIAAAAAVVAALAVGTLVSMRSARIAQENLGLVRKLSNTFVFDVYDSVRELPGSTKARQLIVRTGLEYLDKISGNVGGDTGLQREFAAAYRRIGDVQCDVMGANLGKTGEGLSSYAKALALLESILRTDPTNREVAMEEILVHQRIAEIRSYGNDPELTIASFETAQRRAEALLARAPEDEKAGRRLADVHMDIAQWVRQRADFPRAKAELTKARDLLDRYEKAHPEDLELRRSSAGAYLGIGQVEARLGNLKGALENYRTAVGRLEELVRLEPNNITNQRELMFGYSHIGDVLGYPNLPNLGDSAGAAAAYAKMAGVAKRLYEADPADERAKSDYGIALGRVATLMPTANSRARIATLLQAITLLREAVQTNPDNSFVESQFGILNNLLGDTYRAAGDAGSALRTYLAGLAAAERTLPAGSATTATLYVFLCRKAGELTAQRGDRERSLALGRRALDVANPNSAAAKGRAAAVQRLLTPRAHAAMGSVYATLALTNAGRPGDRAEARKSLKESLRGFREVERHRPLSKEIRREVADVQTYLEALR